MALDYGFIGTILNDTTLFGIHWLVGLVLASLTVLLISRDSEDWPILMFPVYVGFAIIGVGTNPLAFVVMALVYVLSSLSIRGLGKGVEATFGGFRRILAFSPLKTYQNTARSIGNIRSGKSFKNIGIVRDAKVIRESGFKNALKTSVPNIVIPSKKKKTIPIEEIIRRRIEKKEDNL